MVQKMQTDNRPTVSVIIPMKNEEEHISRCLQSVLDQEYPEDLMEVLVVDGMSQDSSREIVSDIAKSYRFVTLLHNPKQVKAAALNKGIAESRGQLILPVDAHCFIAPDYIKECVHTLQQTDAANVGGFVLPTGTNFIQQAIGYAMSSFFGIGSRRFGSGHKEMLVDTVSFGAYRREVFEEIGLYDEEADYGEDDELNYRLVKSGGKIVLSPRIKSYYYPRSSLSGLWKQYYNFGLGKVRTIRKHGKPASWRHLVPTTFVVCIGCSLILFVFHPIFRWLVAGIFGGYLAAAAFVSAIISLRNGWRYFAVLPIIFFTIHVSYGIGFLIGTLSLCLRVHRRNTGENKGR